MKQGENEPLEYYEERFQLSYRRAHSCTLDEHFLKIVLLHGVREELMETLNLLANGDIFQLEYYEIKKIFNNYSKAIIKKNIDDRILNYYPSKPTNSTITRH